jgi:hypothetical protein
MQHEVRIFVRVKPAFGNKFQPVNYRAALGMVRSKGVRACAELVAMFCGLDKIMEADLLTGLR